MSKEQKAKDIEKAIRLVWKSLESHLEWTYDLPKDKCDYCGGKQFHKSTIKDYTEIMKILAKLL